VNQPSLTASTSPDRSGSRKTVHRPETTHSKRGVGRQKRLPTQVRVPVSGKIPGALSGATPFKANPSAIAKPRLTKCCFLLAELIARQRARAGQ
jgi:hypothetical protein